MVAVGLAALYAFLSPPIYQTRAKALPPVAAGLETYNKAYRISRLAIDGVISDLNDPERERLAGEGIPILLPGDAYKSFIRHLSSTTLRRNFFDTHYLSSRYATDALANARDEQLWAKFLGQMTVEVPRRAADGEYITVIWSGADPESIAEWANMYMQMGIEAAQDELASNLESAIQTLRSSLDDQLVSLRSGAEKQRKQHIVRLTEALQLAESIGLHAPSDAGNLIVSYSGETAYMRGADALRNEIILLENRASNDPFIPQLTGILTLQALLNTVAVQPEDITVAWIDENAAPPVNPIKPRRALILALGLVLGGMLGVFIVLIQSMLRRESNIY